MIHEIKFSCSACGQHIACAAEHAGIAIACPGCQASLVVPEAPTLVAPLNQDFFLPVSCPDREAWKNMGLGLGIAILVAYVPFLNWIFQYLSTIIHELGHWIVAIAFGYPSVPAFHVISGGVTITFSRMQFLLLAVYASLGWVLWRNRGNRMVLAVLVAITLVQCIAIG